MDIHSDSEYFRIYERTLELMGKNPCREIPDSLLKMPVYLDGKLTGRYKDIDLFAPTSRSTTCIRPTDVYRKIGPVTEGVEPTFKYPRYGRLHNLSALEDRVFRNGYSQSGESWEDAVKRVAEEVSKQTRRSAQIEIVDDVAN